MSPLKSDLICLIESLPDDCTLDDVLYHLHIRRRVEAGLAAIDEGRFVTHEEAKRRLDSWLKSSGATTR